MPTAVAEAPQVSLLAHRISGSGCLHDATPSALTAVHEMRQTVMLATQRELQDVSWLCRCVADDEVCALMCVWCAGTAGVIRAVGAIV